MKITKIVVISLFGILLSACGSNKMEAEGSAAASMGPMHIHNVEGHGDHIHQHQGNSTAGHAHSWDQLQSEIKKQ